MQWTYTCIRYISYILVCVYILRYTLMYLYYIHVYTYIYIAHKWSSLVPEGQARAVRVSGALSAWPRKGSFFLYFFSTPSSYLLLVPGRLCIPDKEYPERWKEAHGARSSRDKNVPAFVVETGSTRHGFIEHSRIELCGVMYRFFNATHMNIFFFLGRTQCRNQISFFFLIRDSTWFRHSKIEGEGRFKRYCSRGIQLWMKWKNWRSRFDKIPIDFYHRKSRDIRNSWYIRTNYCYNFIQHVSLHDILFK